MATVKVCDMCKNQKSVLLHGSVQIESTHGGIYARGEVKFYVDGGSDFADVCPECIRLILAGERSRATQG